MLAPWGTAAGGLGGRWAHSLTSLTRVSGPILGIPDQQCIGRRPRTTDVTGEILTVDLRAVGATEEHRAEETPGQTCLKGNTGQEGRKASEGRLRLGDWQGAAKPGPPGAREKGPFRDECGEGSVSAPLPAPPFPAGAADVPSHDRPKKQGREGGSTTGETESGELLAGAAFTCKHLKTLFSSRTISYYNSLRYNQCLGDRCPADGVTATSDGPAGPSWSHGPPTPPPK